MTTFGRTSIQIDTGAVSWPGTNSVVSACQFILNDNKATVTKLTTYIATLSVASSMMGVVYDDSSDNPNSVIGVTQQASIAANSLIDLPFSSPFTINSGKYWLGVIANGANLSGGASIIGGAYGINRISASVATTYPAINSPFPTGPTGTGSTVSTNQKLIYATYTTGFDSRLN